MFSRSRKKKHGSTRKAKTKSYQTFPDINSNNGTTSLESSKSEPALRSGRAESFTASDVIHPESSISGGDESSSDSSGPRDNTRGSNYTIASGLTLDLNLIGGVDSQATNTLSAVHEVAHRSTIGHGPLGSSSLLRLEDSSSGEHRPISSAPRGQQRRKNSSSPTFSSHEEDIIRPQSKSATPPHSLTQHSDTHNDPANSVIQPTATYSKSKVCFLIIKVTLCVVVVSSMVLSSVYHQNYLVLTQTTRSLSDITILQPNTSTDIELPLLPSNVTALTISLESLSRYVPSKNSSKVVFSVDIPHNLACESQLNITEGMLVKWSNSPHLVLLSCNLIQTAAYKEDDPQRLVVTISSHMTSSVGLLVDIEISEPTQLYCIAVLCLLILLHVTLITEYLNPIVLLLISASVSTTIHYLCQTAELKAVGEFPHVTTIIPGSLVDQVILVASMMVLVNSLTHTGVYPCVTHQISKLCKGRWKFCVLFLLLMAALFSSLIGRTTTIQLFVPLAICMSEAYHLVGSTLITCLIICTNIGNILLCLGNDVISSVRGSQFISIPLDNTNVDWRIAVNGLVALLVAIICIWFMVMKQSSLEQEKTTFHIRRIHKAKILLYWAGTTTPLTIADKSCLEHIDQEYRLLDNALTHPPNQGEDAEDSSSVNEDEFDLYTNTGFNSWPSAVCYSLLTILVVIAIPIAKWFPWEQLHVVTLTPGLVALTAAVCVVVANGSEEKAIRSINWATILFVALYRYTMETLLSGRLIEWISKIVIPFDEKDTGLASKGERFLFVLVVMVTSGILSILLGAETLSPHMMNILLKLYGKNSVFYAASRISHVVGTLLAANTTLYSSIGNVIASRCAAEHGISLTSAKFIVLGAIVTLLTFVGTIISLTITEVDL